MKIAALFLSAFLALYPFGATAQGVLLPDDEKTSSGGNLGLTPAAPKAEANTEEKKSEKANEGESTGIISGLVNKATSFFKKDTTPQKNTGKASTEKSDLEKILDKKGGINLSGSKGMSFPEPTREQIRKAFGMKDPAMPPTILDEPPEFDAYEMMDEIKKNIKERIEENSKAQGLNPNFSQEGNASQQSLDYDQLFMMPKNNLSVSLDKDYIWGVRDLEQVENMLGYKQQQIPSVCQLRIRIGLSTDKTRGNASIYAGQQKNIPFDGNLRSINFFSSAVCEIPQGNLPQNGGIINRVDGKYAVILRGNTFCDASKTQNPTTLHIKHKGDGQAECNFK